MARASSSSVEKQLEKAILALAAQQSEVGFVTLVRREAGTAEVLAPCIGHRRR
jgi:hypothetical protein